MNYHWEIALEGRTIISCLHLRDTFFIFNLIRAQHRVCHFAPMTCKKVYH